MATKLAAGVNKDDEAQVVNPAGCVATRRRA